MRPNASTHAAANASQSAALVQSPLTHSAVPPSPAIISAVSPAEPTSRSTSSTLAPSRANASDAARPVPTVSPRDCPAPTTIPTFPSSLTRRRLRCRGNDGERPLGRRQGVEVEAGLAQAVDARHALEERLLALQKPTRGVL